MSGGSAWQRIRLKRRLYFFSFRYITENSGKDLQLTALPPFTRAHARGDFLSLLLRSFAAVYGYFTRGVGAVILFRKASQYSPLDRVPALQVRSELALCCRACIHKHIAGERLSAFALPADIYCALSLFGSSAVKKPGFWYLPYLPLLCSVIKLHILAASFCLIIERAQSFVFVQSM